MRRLVRLAAHDHSYISTHAFFLTSNLLQRTGGQIGNNDSADDVKNVNLSAIHYLSGPFEIEGAQPGDVLLVEIVDVQPFQDHPWGFTGVFAKENGGGFLDELYPSAYVSSFLSVLFLTFKNTSSTGTHGFQQTADLYSSYRAKAIWDFEGIYCTSRHIPHVRFAGLIQ